MKDKISRFFLEKMKKSISNNSIFGSVDGEVLTYKRRNYQQAPPKEQVKGKKFNIKKRSVGNTSPPSAKVLCLVAGLKNKELRKHHQDIIELGDYLAEEKEKKSFSIECEHLQWLLTGYVRNTKLSFETRELALKQIYRSCVVRTLTEELLTKEICTKHTKKAFEERAELAYFGIIK